MAPTKKRKADEKAAVVKPTAATTVRVTRSSTRLQNGNSVVADSVTQAPVELQKKKKAKTVSKKKVTEKENVKDDDAVVSKTIVIEHCKQCNSFKTRALQVKKGLEDGVSGIVVQVNPDKPRRGCFEIREEGGEVFITLLQTKRRNPLTAVRIVSTPITVGAKISNGKSRMVSVEASSSTENKDSTSASFYVKRADEGVLIGDMVHRLAKPANTMAYAISFCKQYIGRSFSELPPVSSLNSQDMKRPFAKMKALDVDKVITDIIDKIK